MSAIAPTSEAQMHSQFHVILNAMEVERDECLKRIEEQFERIKNQNSEFKALKFTNILLEFPINHLYEINSIQPIKENLGLLYRLYLEAFNIGQTSKANQISRKIFEIHLDSRVAEPLQTRIESSSKAPPRSRDRSTGKFCRNINP